MKLTRLLVTLGLVHEAEPSVPAQEEVAPVPTQVLSLEELRLQDTHDHARGEAAGLGLDKTWEEIYRDYGLGDPPGGISLEELDRQIQGLSEEEARLVVLGILQEKGAPVREVLLDGQRRDEALDTYERLLEQQVAARRAALEQRVAELTREARALQLRSEDLQAALGAWKKRKNEEEDLMELLGSMLVRLDEQAPTAEPEGPGKATPER
ncbi:MAG: hypothetical protein ACOX9B_10735 [Candidatus Xenobium sp.]|jgi:hypothetical protein|nr:hypothetical protein [Burkholderiales bacterium]